MKEEKTTEALLQELLTWQKKEARRARVAAFFNILLVLALLAALFVLVPRALRLADGAEQSLAEINRLTASAQTLIENADAMVTENTDAVSETVRKLNEVDFEGLNQAIGSLNDAVRPLADLARILGVG